jgi:hypothetical protein
LSSYFITLRATDSVSFGKPIGRRPLGRPRCRWEDNIRMDIREIWWEVVEWMYPAGTTHRQVVGSCEQGNKLLGPIKVGDIFD